MTTTTTPSGASAPLARSREATTAEDATRSDWDRVTAHLRTLPAHVAENLWGLLGQCLGAVESHVAAVPQQRVSAGQTATSIERKS